MLSSLLTIAAASPEATDGGTVEQLASYFHVEPALLIAQGLNFIIVAIVIWKAAFKPVMTTMEERQRKIQDGLQYAEEMKAALANAEKDSAEKIREASEEAAKIVHEARDNAHKFEEAQKAEAVKSAEGIIAKAHAASEQERKQMLADVRKEVAELVVATSAKVLDRDLTSDEKGRFSESAAKELYAN
ncbi:F0F1 ATP synthase subunit B [Cerasicoccus fimbriatus]|uniref:F0F1 ATP synthase subunit B n=1 Tax=Cerasicoccus fimbriatus TaxID=3014554 RepID=UPI0022B4DA9D|nr:F0F1 ATP synthase subunit B [Cerasicoccus sp. TK19100]